MVDAYVELVLENNNNKVHTITYKDPNAILAPTLVAHLKRSYCIKLKQKDNHGQIRIGKFKHMIEEEKVGEEVRDFLAIPPIEHSKEYHDKFEVYFKLALQASPRPRTKFC